MVESSLAPWTCIPNRRYPCLRPTCGSTSRISGRQPDRHASLPGQDMNHLCRRPDRPHDNLRDCLVSRAGSRRETSIPATESDCRTPIACTHRLGSAFGARVRGATTVREMPPYPPAPATHLRGRALHHYSNVRIVPTIEPGDSGMERVAHRGHTGPPLEARCRPGARSRSKAGRTRRSASLPWRQTRAETAERWEDRGARNRRSTAIRAEDRPASLSE